MSTGAGRWELQPDASAAAWLQDLDPVDASTEELQLRRRLRELDEQEQQAASEVQRRSARAKADDIRDEILPRFGARVSELMPDRFAVYGKVLHPIYVDERVTDRVITWDDVARRQRAAGHRPGELVAEEDDDRAGARSASRIRWHELADRYGVAITPELHKESFTAVFGGSWLRYLLAPEEGDLAADQLRVLVGHLAGYTEADETCWFYYWVLKTTHYNGQRVFAGPLRSVLDEPANWDVRGSPSAWWPSSQTWCVVTGFDLAFTIVGGPRDLIDALIDDGELETIQVSPHTRVDRYSDPQPPT